MKNDVDNNSTHLSLTRDRPQLPINPVLHPNSCLKVELVFQVRGMLSGRGRGRGGATGGGRAVLRSAGPQGPGEGPDKRGGGARTVASQALASHTSGQRASSRSPARGQAASGEILKLENNALLTNIMIFPGGRSHSATPTTGNKGKLRTAPVPRSSSPKTAKKRSLGQKPTVKEDAENTDVTETDSVKADADEKAAELVTETPGESKPVQKPVRKQKLPRLNDNPDAPEVVDVPNMRSSHVERLSDARTYENGGTGVNGDCDSEAEEDTALGDKAEPLKDSKVTLDDRVMPPLITGEDKPCQEDRDKDKGVESGVESPDKSDSIVLIPLSDESCDVKGAGAKVTIEQDHSAETKDQLNGQGDEMLTNMIRENLNRAVSISNDSSSASSVDEMKQSLLNAIKDTLESSNSKPKTEDSSDGNEEILSTDEENELIKFNSETVATEPLLFIKNGKKVTSQPYRKQLPSKDTKEEVITNGDLVNGDHKETEHSGSDSSDLGDSPGDVKEKNKDGEVGKTEEKEDDLADEDLKTDLITNAEIEISPEPIEKNGNDSSLATSGDGINDLIIDIQSNNSLKENSSKDIVPKEGSATITSLDQLEKGMLPVSSVQIEHVDSMEEDGAVPENLEVVDIPGISVVVTEEEEKPKLNIDKDKLFSQMNDIFAKDTHKALKNKPVYQKRGRQGKEDQVETKQQSPPAKKKKLKGNKKNKTSDKQDKEEPPVEKEASPMEDESESVDSEDIPPPVLERSAPSKDLISEDESLLEEEETPPTTSDVVGNNGPEIVPDKEITVEAESMDLLEKLEMLEEGFEEENLEEEEKEVINNCDISPEDEEDGTKETLETTNEGQKENTSSAKDTTEHSSSSELTKSLRKARPFKKSPSKILSKEKSWEEDPASEEDQGMDGSSSSPVKELSSSSVPKAGPDVFDFTDEEDLPLSNIDMDVLEAASGKTSHKISPGDSEEPQPTLDHELSQLSPQSKSSPNKLSRVRSEVSPQILSVTDAVAAVAALQVGLDDIIKEDIKEDLEDGDDVKMNGEAGSDGDTDNSTSNGRTSQFSEKPKVSVKRKKRRVAESDEGKRTQYILLFLRIQFYLVDFTS